MTILETLTKKPENKPVKINKEKSPNHDTDSSTKRTFEREVSPTKSRTGIWYGSVYLQKL